MFGKQFATKPVFIRAGFDRIASGIDLPWLTRRRLYSRFEAAHRSGDPKQERAALSETLTGVDWRWPWLESCAASFVPQGVWPLAWTQLGIPAPLDWMAVPEQTRQELLLGTLGHAVYVERDLADFRQMEIGYVSLRNEDERCAASALLCRMHADRIRAGHYAERPPFFPGDQCSLQWEEDDLVDEQEP